MDDHKLRKVFKMCFKTSNHSYAAWMGCKLFDQSEN